MPPETPFANLLEEKEIKYKILWFPISCDDGNDDSATFHKIGMRRNSNLFISRAVWPDLANFCQFSKNLEIFVNIWKVYLIFDKVVNTLWDFLYGFEQHFIVVNGQILKNNFASGHTDQEWTYFEKYWQITTYLGGWEN